MSQIIKTLTSGGPIPPAIPTSFVTDVNSPSVPIANVENLIGGTSTLNKNNGIFTDGSSGSNTTTIFLSNRFIGSVTTTNATPTTIATLALGSTPGVYIVDANIAAFDTTDTLGAGYSVFGTTRTTGAASVLCGTPDKIVNEEAGVTAADCNMTVSGNSVNIVATGIAGKTIDWNCVATFVFVS